MNGWKMETYFIGMPVFHNETTESRITLNNLIRHTRELQLIEQPYLLYNQSCIPFARNEIAQRMLETKANYLMFIDADIYIRDKQYFNAIDRLYLHNKPIIGGVYVCKNPPFQPAISTIQKYNHGATYERFDRMANPLKVPYCATGFLLIKREVLEVCGINCFNLRYYKKEEMREYQMPEDYSFCDLAAEKGFNSWVDTKIEILHVGIYYYGLKDFYGVCEQTLKLKEGAVLPPMQATI